MKFIHTADWHLGKLVHGVYMTEEQRYLLKQFVQLVEKEQPDAVIIAGDLYDRSVPPTDAVELLDETLFKINVELKIPVIAIGGNHDSAERLSFGSSWYRHSKFFLAGKLTNNFEPITIKGVNFYLIPYAEPGVVRQLFEDESIKSHQDAFAAIIGRIEPTLRENEANVLVGHAFVLGGETSDSERTLSVGGTGCVQANLFSPFSYTALGHLHNPDAIRHQSIKYAGSLLKYSFSEAKQQKAISIVNIDEHGTFTIEKRTLQPLKDMRELEGHLEELLDPAFYEQQKTDDYLKITLLDEGAILDPMNKLRQVYPNVLHLERKIQQRDMKRKQMMNAIKERQRSEFELFAQFYEEVTTASFTEDKREIIVQALNKAHQEG
ncbi:exonuclease SbcCD subunit D [Bacillaceae bacterium Marseille-Q3522]|nr:exonuclease SbcCD subunit D [Bacillaceae bacterium Marseille-Q3522]